MAIGYEPTSSSESNGEYTVWSDLAVNRIAGSLSRFTINAAGSPSRSICPSKIHRFWICNQLWNLYFDQSLDILNLYEITRYFGSQEVIVNSIVFYSLRWVSFEMLHILWYKDQELKAEFSIFNISLFFFYFFWFHIDFNLFANILLPVISGKIAVHS